MIETQGKELPISQFLALKIDEMNQFYSQLNISAYQKQSMLQQLATQTHTSSSQLAKKNDFDEKPIVCKEGKNFLELLEEKLTSENQSYPPKIQPAKTFLKKQRSKQERSIQSPPKKELSSSVQENILDKNPDVDKLLSPEKGSLEKENNGQASLEKGSVEEMGSTQEKLGEKQAEKSKQEVRHNRRDYSPKKQLSKEDPQKPDKNDKAKILEKESIKTKELQKRVKLSQKKQEDMIKILQYEKEEFQKKVARFNEEKEKILLDEKEKLQKEFRLLEKQQKMLLEIQVHKNNQEMDDLTKQIKQTSELIESNENNFKHQLTKQANLIIQLNRLAKQMADLKEQNSLLHEQLQELSKENPTSIVGSSPDKSKPRAFTTPKKNVSKTAETPPEAEKPRFPNTKSNSKSVNQFKKQRTDSQSDLEQEEFGFPMDYMGDGEVSLANLVVEEDLFYYNCNLRYKKYERDKKHNSEVLLKKEESDGKVHLFFEDGKKEVIFDSGIHKEIFSDGYTVVHFLNSDVKQVFPNGVVVYYFDDAHATQTTLPNGQNIYKFLNKQIEIHHRDGSKEIKQSVNKIMQRYQNGAIKQISQEDRDKVKLQDDEESIQLESKPKAKMTKKEGKKIAKPFR